MEVVSGLGLAFGFWFFGENNSPTMSPLILPPPLPPVLIGGGGEGWGGEGGGQDTDERLPGFAGEFFIPTRRLKYLF
jgi:hypothetical protein